MKTWRHRGTKVETTNEKSNGTLMGEREERDGKTLPYSKVPKVQKEEESNEDVQTSRRIFFKGPIHVSFLQWSLLQNIYRNKTECKVNYQNNLNLCYYLLKGSLEISIMKQ